MRFVCDALAPVSVSAGPLPIARPIAGGGESVGLVVDRIAVATRQ